MDFFIEENISAPKALEKLIKKACWMSDATILLPKSENG
jgi:hypothetical protein